MQDAPAQLLVDVARLAPGGETVEGEADIADVQEEFVKASGPMRYRLFVQAFGTEVVARGSLAQDFRFVCSRCGGDFERFLGLGRNGRTRPVRRFDRGSEG